MNGWILNMQCCTTCFLIRHPKTRKHNMLHVERSERSSRACESVQSWLNLKAPTTAQWTAVTLLLSHARPLQRLSAWCQAQCFLLRASSLRPLASMERYSWTSQALVPEFRVYLRAVVTLIQKTLILVAVALVWTSEPWITCILFAIPGNIGISHSTFTNCSNMF